MAHSDWLTEEQTPGYRTQWKIRRVLYETQTPYQHLQVVEMEDFGKALVLDSAVQTTVGDEYIYHEMIAHVPLLTHPNPQRVLVVGGGDGGTVREVLKHPEVQHVDMVEIDEAVIEACRKYLPEIACAFDDPRLSLHVADGIAWMSKANNEYDVILVDSSDPVGPAVGLFRESFYQDVFRALKPGGIFVCQTLSPFFNQQLIRDVHRIVARIFPIARLCLTVVPTYPSGFHCFTLGSKEYDPAQGPIRSPGFPTKWYTPEVHRASFVLPPVVAELLK
ncbi:MAG TPA: polyamine aminopropyltransferase [Symbiobacteriaceae bacterium]